MKKWICIALAMLLTAALMGCGGKRGEMPAQSGQPQGGSAQQAQTNESSTPTQHKETQPVATQPRETGEAEVDISDFE